MQINDANDFRIKWSNYTNLCLIEIKKAVKNGNWTPPEQNKNIYIIVPDAESGFQKGKIEKGPITKEQMIRRIKDLHDLLRAQNLERCLDSLNENMQGVPPDVPIVVTLAFIKPQSMPPVMNCSAIMMKTLFLNRRV